MCLLAANTLLIEDVRQLLCSSTNGKVCLLLPAYPIDIEATDLYETQRRKAEEKTDYYGMTKEQREGLQEEVDFYNNF